ncbi:MAG: hypothetical protein NTY38_02665, partial [Acidobacteria bacterium]|nr:hypothetical protein [Acidobacteriota bacterium]
RRVERRVNLDGYRLSLQYGGEEYPIGDPLRASVGDFLAKISAAGSDAGRDGADRILTTIGMSFGFLNACASLTERADA